MRQTIDFLGLELCNEQSYCIGKETFCIPEGKRERYVNTLDYIMYYGNDIQCECMLTDSIEALHIHSDHYTILSVWNNSFEGFCDVAGSGMEKT